MRPTVFLLSVSSLVATVTASETIISNLGEPLSNFTNFGAGSTTITKDFGFTMGSDDFRLDEVVLSLEQIDANASPVLDVRADAGGTAGATLFTLDNPAVLLGDGDFTFEAGATFTLEAGTTYWLSLRSDPVDGDRFLWSSTLDGILPTGDHATGIEFQFNGNTSTFFNSLEIRGTAEIGVNYCDATVNSTGVAGALTASGSRFVADGDLTLTASNLPNGAFGYFITSQTQGFVMNPGTSVGNLCLAGAIGRYVAPGQVLNTGMEGSFSLTLDLANTPQPTGAVAIVAGETWNFQAWHRDALPTGATSNYTVGLQVDFE